MYYTIPISQQQISIPNTLQTSQAGLPLRQSQINKVSEDDRDKLVEKVNKLIHEIEIKNNLCKQKEKEIEYWQAKFNRLSLTSKKSEKGGLGLEEVGNLQGEIKKLCQHLQDKDTEIEEMKTNLITIQQENDRSHELINSYGEKLKTLLTENERLNQICEMRLDQNNTQIIEIDSLKLELTEKTIENDLLNEKVVKISSEFNQFKLDHQNLLSTSSQSQEKIRILLNENKKLNENLNDRVNELSVLRQKLSDYERTHDVLTNTLEQNEHILQKEMERIKLSFKDLEARNNFLEGENERLTKTSEELQEHNYDLNTRLENYKSHSVEKSIYTSETKDQKSRIIQLESHLSKLLTDNNRLIASNNSCNEELELAQNRYENLERNHAEHIKQLKKNWENNMQSNLELGLKEKTMKLNLDIQSLESELENNNQYIGSLEEKNEESLKTINFLNQKVENQRKTLVKLESEKERIEIYQGKLREVEERHLEELEQQKDALEKRLQAEFNEEMNNKIMELTQACNDLQQDMDLKQQEIEEWKQKLATYEQFHQMKMSEMQRHLEEVYYHNENTKKSSFIEIDSQIHRMQEEKIHLLEEIDSWKNKGLDLERKFSGFSTLEGKIEILSNQNTGLNQNLQSVMQENMYLKEQSLEMGKMNHYLYDLESKMKFLMAENERLNRIIISRCKEMLNY